jgi:hypothetical protein
MLVTNISDTLVNGKTRCVQKLDDQNIYVCFDVAGISKVIKMNRFVFTKFDPVNRCIVAKNTQFPLTLAYSLTIHKSQGMSLDIVIDCKNATLPGQIGVAEGRVKFTDGLYVKNFKPSLCSSHPVSVHRFYKSCGMGVIFKNCKYCKSEITNDEDNNENGGGDDVDGDSDGDAGDDGDVGDDGDGDELGDDVDSGTYRH